MKQLLLTNGVTIHYQLDGNSSLPLLVFANSLGTDLRVWDALLPLLAKQFCFLRYDMRGQGLSDCPAAPYALEDHIADLEYLLDALQIQQATLCGLSVGGMVVQGLAARRPDLLQALILCNTAHQIGSRNSWEQRINTIKAQGLSAIADAVMARWFAPQFLCQRTAELALWRNMLLATPLAGYLGTCAALRDADLRQPVSRLRLPVLCIAGEHDGATAPELVKSTAGLIAGAHFAVLADCGHLPCVEQPAALAALILQFTAGTGADTETARLPASRFARGTLTRRAVLGNTHVDGANACKTAFDEPFQTYITESAWGSVWNRPGLSLRDRSLLTIALMAAGGHQEELKMHIRATRNTGASREEVQETLLHIAVYAGVPFANIAFKLAKEVYREFDHHEEQ